MPESDELHHGELGDQTESLLDRFHRSRRGRGFRSATVVGTGFNDSNLPGQLVVGISQRLVLDQPTVRASRVQSNEEVGGFFLLVAAAVIAALALIIS